MPVTEPSEEVVRAMMEPVARAMALARERVSGPSERTLKALSSSYTVNVKGTSKGASLDPQIRRFSSKMCQITYKATNSVCRHLFLQSRTKQA